MMTRSQRWLLVLAGIAGVLLFAGLAGASALVTWFALPDGLLQGDRH